MNFPRPLTRIHQIELSSRCNLACVYCPHPQMQRPKIDMDWKTFLVTMRWVRYFQDNGDNQTELSLTGIGEALLHPEFIQYLRWARRIFDGRLLLATNGIAVTEELADAIAEAKCKVYVSLHRPEVGAPAIELLKSHGVAVGVNMAFATSSLDWAGTVKWHVSAPKTECQYLRQGWGTVLADGRITTCCMDSEGLGVIGHVNDVPGSASVKSYSLCDTCHLAVPV